MINKKEETKEIEATEQGHGAKRNYKQPVKFYQRYRKKVCRFCTGQFKEITYKDVEILRKFISDRGKILPRRITGNCAKHQRRLAKAIKQARILALIPFVAE